MVWDRGRLFPMVQFEIERVGEGAVPLAALIDTGFTEWLALPPHAIERLGLSLVDSQKIEFGNSNVEMIDVYEARVYWSGTWRTINTHSIPGLPTIGMELLRGHRIEFDAMGGALIDVEPVR